MGFPATIRVDQGTAFVSRDLDLWAYQRGVALDFSQPGKPTDNAFIESFFHSMKTDIYHGLRYERDDEIRAALRSYVPFYNHDRLHSSLSYVPPATFEQQARRTGCQ